MSLPNPRLTICTALLAVCSSLPKWAIAADHNPKQQSKNSKTKKCKAWRYWQTSEYWGKQTAVISPVGIMVTMNRMGISLDVPDLDHVAMRCDRTKSYCIHDFAYWSNLMSNQSIKRGSKIRKKVGKDTVAGLPTSVWLMCDPTKLSNQNTPDMTVDGQKYNLKVWVAEGVRVPAQYARLFENLLGIPNEMGFPVRVEYYLAGKVIRSLDTEKRDEVEVEASTFAIPSDFRRVDDIMAVMVQGGEEGGMFGGVVGVGVPDALNPTGDTSESKTSMETDLREISISLNDKKNRPKQTISGWVPGLTAEQKAQMHLGTKRRRAHLGSWIPRQPEK